MLTRSKIAPHEHMKNKKINWRLPIIAAGFWLAVGVLYALHLTVNVSESMKKGLYIGAGHSIHRGDIVAVCLDKNNATIGLKQGYVLRGKACASGITPLIKEVLAMPGDTIVLADNSISVNGKYYPYATQKSDTQGRPLSMVPRGAYPAIKGYFLIGVSAPNSWDSRYWGLADKSQVLYRLIPLWTF